MLSDNLIRPVHPRVESRNRFTNFAEIHQPTTIISKKSTSNVNQIQAGGEMAAAEGSTFANETNSRDTNVTKVHLHSTPQAELSKAVAKQKRQGSSKPCRRAMHAAQVRYRKKQRDMLLQLEHSVTQLSQERCRLKRMHRDLVLDKTICQGSPIMVAKMFTILESNFRSPWYVKVAAQRLKNLRPRQRLLILGGSFHDNADIGDVYGVHALANHLRYYWKYFDEPRILLQHVKWEVPAVMIATARLSMTISEFTLEQIFSLSKNRKPDDKYRALYQHLVGQRLHCTCVSRILFDEKSNLVAHVSTNISLVSPLIQVLGSLDNVLAVFGMMA